MNINKLQAQLQHVPDQALIGYVQNPDGQVPSYLALAEITRRKEIRKAAAPQQAAPTQTVAAQELAQAEPGIAQLPLKDEQMFSEQSYATGGIVAFAQGGDTGFRLSSPEAQWNPIGSAAYKQNLQDLYEAQKAKTPWVSYDDFVRQVKSQQPAAASDAEMINAATLPKKAAPLNYDRPTAQQINTAAVPPLASTTVARPGIAGVAGGPGYKEVTYTDMPFDAAAYEKLKEAPVTAQEKMAEWQNLVGPNEGLAALKGRLDTMETKAAKEAETAPWMALAKAGFSMAGGKSRNAISNIAEGAQVGLADYAAAKDKLAAAEEKRFGIQSQLAQADRAEKVAAAKYGVDSEEHIKAQNRATDLAAIGAKSNIDVTNKTNRLKAEEANAKNALDAQQNAITAQHYADWKSVQQDANQKSVANMDKAEKQQQTALLSASLRDIDAQLKDPALMLDKNRAAQLQQERAAINARLYELAGVKYNAPTASGVPGLAPDRAKQFSIVK